MYLQIDEGFLSHPKTLRFCRALNDHAGAIYLMRLWTWAIRSAPDGDLSGLHPEDVEIAVRWMSNGREGHCYKSLVECGFLDVDENGHVHIHNWDKRTGRSVQILNEVAENKRKYWKQKKKEQRSVQQMSNNCPTNVPGDIDGDKLDCPPHRTEQDPIQDSSCSEPQKPAPSPRPIEPAVLTFPVKGTEAEWALVASHVSRLSKAFPGIDVLGEARKACEWVTANPVKRKTSRGMAQFLYGWVERASNRGRAATLPFAAGPKTPPTYWRKPEGAI